MNRSTVWKIMKKFQETENNLDLPERGIKTVYPLPSTPEKHEGKSATKPSAKLQNLDHRSQCEQLHMHPVLRDDLVVKPFKMLHRQELTPNYVAMRAKMQENSSGDRRLHATEPRVQGRE